MTQELLQYLFSGITNGAIYAVIAIGFSMLYSSTELINFAHGEFVMLGALSLVTLWGGFGLPLPMAFILSVFGVALTGLVFERLAIRTVRKPDHIVLIIITVGASIFLRGVSMLIWGKDAYSLPAFTDHPPLDLIGARLLPQSIWIVFIALVCAILLHLFFKKTLTGKAMEATAISKKAAWLTGIPSEKMILLAFFSVPAWVRWQALSSPPLPWSATTWEQCWDSKVFAPLCSEVWEAFGDLSSGGSFWAYWNLSVSVFFHPV